MSEAWKPFADGNYEVSSHGRVRRATPGRCTYPGRLMTLVKMKIGYHQVMPTINGKNVHFYVHQLVAEAFIGPCPDGCEVNHKDGDKTNNRVSNLEYVTHRENSLHALKSGLVDNQKISNETISVIQELRRRGGSYSQIAVAAGVSIATAFRHGRAVA